MTLTSDVKQRSQHNRPNVPVNSKTAHPPPLGQTLGHWAFLKNFGQIPRCVASLDGQMPHPLASKRVKSPTLQAC